MTKIIAFPPVGAIGREWTFEAPVLRSQYLFSGKRAVSSAGPSRRLASLTVSALARGQNGAGYTESMKALLDGGMHLVRLWSWPVNWYLDALREADRFTEPMSWTAGAVAMNWTAGGAQMTWFTGPVPQGTPGTDSIGPTITITGLPPNALAVRPYEVLRVYPAVGGASVTARSVGAVTANASGVAVVRLHSALPEGTVSIGDTETAVFEVQSMPRAVQPVSGDWSYQWDFREVLASEIDSPEEVNPWL